MSFAEWGIPTRERVAGVIPVIPISLEWKLDFAHESNARRTFLIACYKYGTTFASWILFPRAEITEEGGAFSGALNSIVTSISVVPYTPLAFLTLFRWMYTPVTGSCSLGQRLSCLHPNLSPFPGTQKVLKTSTKNLPDVVAIFRFASTRSSGSKHLLNF